MRRLQIILLLIMTLSPAWALTMTVTNCAGTDSDVGSLPWALAGVPNEPSVIQFNIPNTDPGFTSEGGVSFWRIKPANKLRIIRDNIEVRGSTQTTNQGDNNPLGPEIEVSGVNLPALTNLFEISGNNNCIIEGFIITGATSFGVSVSTGNNNQVYGCYIGCDASGEGAAPNAGGGMFFDRGGSNNVGGAPANQACIISGNAQNGILISNSTNMNIIGCLIGTKRTGIDGLGNAGNGLLLKEGAHSQYIANGNKLAFNGGSGVQIDGAATIKNTLTQNSFFSNAGQGISLTDQGNIAITYPTIATSEYYSLLNLLYVQGTGPADSTIELLKTETPEVESRGEGKKTIGFATSDGGGSWFVYFATNEVQPGEKLTAIATDKPGNTSEFGPNKGVVSGTVVYRPDAMIATLADGSDYIGVNVFNTNGSGQTKKKSIYLGQAAPYYIKVKNSGNISPDRIVLKGSGDSAGWKVRYFEMAGSSEITGDITGINGWITPNLPSSESLEIMMIAESIGTTASTKDAIITALSYSNPSRTDVVKAETEALTIPQVDLYSFSISVPTTAEANKPFAMTVTARNINGAITTEVAGMSRLTVDAGLISVTTIESSQFADDGIWQGSVSLSNVGLRTLSLRNDYISGVATAQIAVLVPSDVAAGGLYRFGPNPYSPASGQNAVFWYWLNEDQATSVNLFDMQGSLIYKAVYPAGTNGGKSGINSVSFNGRNVFDEIMENGIYLVRIAQGSKAVYSGKIIILK